MYLPAISKHCSRGHDLSPILSLVHPGDIPLKFQHFSLFSNQMLVFMTGCQILANREDPDLGLPHLSWPFWQASSVGNLSTFIVIHTFQLFPNIAAEAVICPQSFP